MAKKCLGNNGFTYIELIIAVGIMSVFVLGVAGAGIASQKQARNIKETGQLLATAEKLTEAFRGISKSTLVAKNNTTIYPAENETTNSKRGVKIQITQNYSSDANLVLVQYIDTLDNSKVLDVVLYKP